VDASAGAVFCTIVLLGFVDRTPPTEGVRLCLRSSTAAAAASAKLTEPEPEPEPGPGRTLLLFPGVFENGVVTGGAKALVVLTLVSVGGAGVCVVFVGGTE